MSYVANLRAKMLQYTYIHPFYGPLDFVRDYPGEPIPEPIWILLKQETVSGNGISWAMCKSAPCRRQTTMPSLQQSVFYRPDVLLSPNQQRQSTEGKQKKCYTEIYVITSENSHIFGSKQHFSNMTKTLVSLFLVNKSTHDIICLHKKLPLVHYMKSMQCLNIQCLPFINIFFCRSDAFPFGQFFFHILQPSASTSVH